MLAAKGLAVEGEGAVRETLSTPLGYTTEQTAPPECKGHEIRLCLQTLKVRCGNASRDGVCVIPL